MLEFDAMRIMNGITMGWDGMDKSVGVGVGFILEGHSQAANTHEWALAPMASERRARVS